MEQVEVLQRYFSSLPDPMEKDIHAFCDASQNTYYFFFFMLELSTLELLHHQVLFMYHGIRKVFFSSEVAVSNCIYN